MLRSFQVQRQNIVSALLMLVTITILNWAETYGPCLGTE